MYGILNKINIHKTSLNSYHDSLIVLESLIELSYTLLIQSNYKDIKKNKLLDKLTEFILNLKKSNNLHINFICKYIEYYNENELIKYILEYYQYLNNIFKNIDYNKSIDYEIDNKYIVNIIFNISRLYQININELYDIVEYKNNYKRV